MSLVKSALIDFLWLLSLAGYAPIDLLMSLRVCGRLYDVTSQTVANGFPMAAFALQGTHPSAGSGRRQGTHPLTDSGRGSYGEGARSLSVWN